MIDLVTTEGIFSLDGEDFAVENNIWLIGNDREVLVIDAAHHDQPIIEAVHGRHVVAIVLTHGHNDHINAAVSLAEMVNAPIWLHPDDRFLWDVVYPGHPPDQAISTDTIFAAGGTSLTVLHTPGHSPGGCCLYDAAGGVVFTGDTLFKGGPGATGRSFSDFAVIIGSIRDQLLPLPGETRVYPGHGATTTIGHEAPHLSEWIERGA